MTGTDELLPYPTPKARRSGCKVSWHYYDDRSLAENAAQVARHNAGILERLGYDFGFASPGSIAETRCDQQAAVRGDEPIRAGWFEVCIP